MRILVTMLLLTACNAEVEQESIAERLLYAAGGRDRLCISGQRGGLIIYGAGNANCSARGRIERSGEHLVLIPDGDADCRIQASQDADRLVLGPLSKACAYYCGPEASYAGKSLGRSDSASPAVDFAGDPLC